LVARNAIAAHHHRARHHPQVLARVFGVLIVLLPIGGSLWIMANLNIVPMDRLMQMPRQARRFG
jgi:hypothetical protein